MGKYIVELKKNETAESALDQIKEKQYYESLSHYQGDLLFVGISYDEKEKTHTCRMERFEFDGFRDAYLSATQDHFEEGLELFEAAREEGKKNPMTEEEAEAFVEAVRREKHASGH